MTRIAISGFGRIGRSALRAALTGRGSTPVAIADVQDLSALAALAARGAAAPRPGRTPGARQHG